MFYKEILDYDTQLRAEGREEGREEGEAKGRAEGINIGITKMLELIKSGLSLEEAQRKISEEQHELPALA